MVTKKLGLLKVSKIVKIIDETPSDCRVPVKSYTLTIPEIAKFAEPGQFAMMWLLGVDEKPMGIAGANQKTGEIIFAVAKVGPATTAFHKLKKGDKIGIKGPFGKGFTIKGKNIAVIGGGTGIAPTKFLIEHSLTMGINVTLFHGARSKNELAFREYFEKLEKEKKNFHYKPSTDDGSHGFKGFATECLQDSIDNEITFNQMYTCGPELMMYAAWNIATQQTIPIEACLADRYFKCAIGLCGQCTVDPVGLRLCIDGPVFNQDQLKEISDFGKFARDKFGRKEPL
ncbi:MAG: dihydroorotate dehydrogenase electron transfer subunit [Candidatus Heimdallarchaeota archaeon]|nr:dihydroorotate dehydrogenase electron transfer subunit [Candidatus Heimdallarchaeota archaeon]MBY8994131.1 dihydroorotate dehydrogenase electron transfer subunit [Candidatus Heimdallarchaeota archaeon]